ncbi:AbrB/MazE/SpoVT family DNA-binding domain-containing protein [Micromonospora aurantiaca]|uniref:AbrB/MazE/SpoVT family DNA-binding domain-containing protein n=1 Tax=Micromonospora aurantiaca (nom. illeg.) TaxID=47850 RepID=A0A6N3KAI9_9ACTN|nr:AbrB/MazE/SpoVT family DNA-binding domain-containing protein [Micromonospora aurantiaca]
MDCNGRLADATVIPSLGWVAGTRLDIRVSGGLVLLTADSHAVFRVTRPGQVRLPATVRHWCALAPGSRVLLVAEPAAGRLVVHPPAALHTMITGFHATVLGGEAA